MESFIRNQSEIRAAIELLNLDMAMVLIECAKRRSNQPSVINTERKKVIVDNINFISQYIDEMKNIIEEKENI